jgi:hypothetical protein
MPSRHWPHASLLQWGRYSDWFCLYAGKSQSDCGIALVARSREKYISRLYCTALHRMIRDQDRKRYDALVINLRTLPLCNCWERLMVVDETFIVVDRRLGQSLRRWWYGDNRQMVVAFLGCMVEDVAYFVNAPRERITRQMKSRIIQLLPCFRTALTRVKCVYENDTITSFSVENIIDEVDSIMSSVSQPSSQLEAAIVRT